MDTKVNKIWSQKHYNAIAKEIRDIFPTSYTEPQFRIDTAQRGILSELALNLCKRFKEDSDEATLGHNFNPLKFLDACSPNTDLYPLSELWQED